MIRFKDDDLGYLAWIAAHPNGFVLNVRFPPDFSLRRPAPGELYKHFERHFRTGCIYGAKPTQNMCGQ